MSSNNWLDSLAALRDSMGPADDSAESAADTASPAPATDSVQEKARLDILLDKKGRGGKKATIICGFTIDDDAVAELATQLRRSLGTGGSARGGEILLQGDRRKDALEALTARGYKARII